MSESKPRRPFTEEFKREAVHRAQERGNLSAVARDLGIPDSVLQRWKKRLEEGEQPPFPGHGHPRDEERAKRERENARLKEENQILKKAVMARERACVGIFTRRPQ